MKFDKDFGAIGHVILFVHFDSGAIITRGGSIDNGPFDREDCSEVLEILGHGDFMGGFFGYFAVKEGGEGGEEGIGLVGGG